jgi:hypothetical protein
MLPAVQSQAPVRKTRENGRTDEIAGARESRAGRQEAGLLIDLDEFRLNFDWPPHDFRTQRQL